jgi:hypothetical protein
MTTSTGRDDEIDDPAGPEPRWIDARRVDPAAKQDFFWVVAANSEPGLLLRLADDTDEVRPLPRMRNLDLSYREVAGKRSLMLLLRDAEQRNSSPTCVPTLSGPAKRQLIM